MSNAAPIADSTAATASQAALRALLVQRGEDRRQGDAAVALIAAAADVAREAAAPTHDGRLDAIG